MTTTTKSRRTKKKAGESLRVTETGGARAGDILADTESRRANVEIGRATEKTAANGNGKGKTALVTETANAQEERQSGADRRGVTEAAVDALCRSLQSLERQRRFSLKQCIRGENAITAFVAWNACGFHTGIPTEAEREKLWKQAGELIKWIDSGEPTIDFEEGSATEDEVSTDSDGDSVAAVDTEDHLAVADDSGDDSRVVTDPARIAGVVRISQISRKAWAGYERGLMDEMVRLAGQLPVAPWLSEPETRGISLGMLATIVGESGNLSNYPNPAKLWKRLFGAPIEKNGKTMMPSRWRLEKGLSSEEWEEAGYSPQRHATMQQMKENIVRQNLLTDKETKEVTWVGPYRKRYDEAKQRTRETHPEWWSCGKCDGTGKVGRKKCQNCKGTGEVSLHPHRHAQLLAAKRFVRDLWNRWHGLTLDTERRGVPRRHET